MLHFNSLISRGVRQPHQQNADPQTTSPGKLAEDQRIHIIPQTKTTKTQKAKREKPTNPKKDNPEKNQLKETDKITKEHNRKNIENTAKQIISKKGKQGKP